MAVYAGLPVNLPQAATRAGRGPETASVTIDHDGHAMPEPRAGRHGGSRSARAPAAQGNPALAIVINADGDAAHRHVVAVLDALRLAGVSRMAIAVTPTSEAR